MLKKDQRLKSFLINLPKTISTPIFVVKTGENKGAKSRFGFIASKSIDKRAVVRNRAKRVLRSLIEENALSIRPGVDFVFILKKGILNKRREEISSILNGALRKEKLLN